MSDSLDFREQDIDTDNVSTIWRHRGQYPAMLDRHRKFAAQAVAKGPVGIRDLAAHQVRIIADPRVLRCAWDHLEAKGGQTPGPNGLQYRDLADHEVWRLCRCLGKAIRDQSYTPGPEKVTYVTKGPGRGSRPITLQNIEDRVVQRAMVEVLQPLLDPLFLPFAFGGRPGRNRLQALAVAEYLTSSGGYPVWICDDVRDAFLNVPLERLLQILRSYLPDDDLVWLIRVVIQNSSMRGLRQGGCLSPLMLSLYLHHLLDFPWQKESPDLPLIRVVDDVLVLCRTTAEAQDVYVRLRGRLASAGLSLKGKPATAIRQTQAGDVVEWLGFVLEYRKQKLKVRVGQRSWSRLYEHLALAHQKPDSPLRARAIIKGWTAQMGLCYRTKTIQRNCARICMMAESLSFDEVPPPAYLRGLWQRAYARTRKQRLSVHRRLERGLDVIDALVVPS